MKCPYCSSKKTEVFNSRSTQSSSQIWRRRRCLDCDKAMTSYERIDLKAVLKITDNSQKEQPYNRTRLLLSVVRAFENTDYLKDIDSILDTAEQNLVNLHLESITKVQIVDVILHTLKPIDTSAFMKYLADHIGPLGVRDLNKLIKKY